MKKIISVVLLIVLLFSFSVTAFAADGVVGSFFTKLSEVRDFIIRAIVPDKNYFHNKLGDLSGRINDRFGGVAYLYLMITDFSKTLQNAPTASLIFNIPNNFLYRGYKGVSLDFFTSAKPYISFLHSALTASCYLFTAVICYKKLVKFFNQ